MSEQTISRVAPVGVALAGGPRFRILPPLSLYIHVPWCVRKCPYCDFNSHEARGDVPEAAYVDALIADLESALPLVWGRKFYTIFFGGGTPSLLSAAAIERLLSAVRARVPLATDAEVTLEANPGTFEAERFAAYRAAGVNRLSIGIQSFDPRFLKALGRIHDDKQAEHAIEIARAHFENFNLDLMYALPGQMLGDVRSDLRRALAFSPPHLSLYHLTIEPNTYFHRFPPTVPDDDAAAEMQAVIESTLSAAGYEHYETSAYARHGRRSRHNLNYWTFGDYLGIGAGAHSKLSFPDRVARQARFRQPREYMEKASAGAAIQTGGEITEREIAFEFMMNALRLSDGFALTLFEERAGIPLTAALKALDEAERRGLIARDHQRVQPTELGRRFLNDLLQLFLP
ncbi:MAG TPA: radical SAM family heme chaperone HemW [Burkholderiales bacterium]|nr:radical SAM family heme chaperone HemW [Burkholderiales bacterium]